ncbi:[Fe-Fe] hydrogenase large subunit C-terminal domain-containing protein [uncultured Acidaminococcus sp.]|uniref:[Fe-Fe] hydrogenase large subunit C-terminal domain-containing protein n=1 Tax=uncultured Acidaminococcus sp. TaxID=352152 RepID=UPI0025D745EE|nr:[Fe-Fe] hydrogenase large subunit C-terminal domain-containing protein [uncultured Acidaminococcus sp.]
MDRSYLNSVRVEEDRCTGCLLCVKKCLVQAIRVRDGKAVIISDRCIDCGECIRCCPTRAIAALVEPLEELKSYKVNIALATPSFYAQFDGTISASILWQGLKEIGFDSVFDVPLAGDYISEEIEAYLASYKGPYPVISSACPAVLRLIQTKYPELICHVVPALAPAEAAAIYVRRETMKRLNLAPEDVGIWFLSPCPAKGTNIHQSVDVAHTAVTGSFTLASLYGPLSVVISEIRKEKNELPQALVGTSYELLWGTERGELISTGCRHGLSVSGPEDVDEVLKQITLGSLTDVEYVSCYICDGGCVGGPSVAVNKFVGTKNLERRAMLRHEREWEDRREAMQAARICENFPSSKNYIKSLQAKPAPPLDPDFGTAMEKMERLTALSERLPGLDCGACGAPTCRIFAEDVIRGFAKEEDCIIRSRRSRKK